MALVIRQERLLLDGFQRGIGHTHPFIRIEEGVTGAAAATTTAATIATNTTTTAAARFRVFGWADGCRRVFSVDVDGLTAVGQRQVGPGSVHGRVLGVHGAVAPAVLLLLLLLLLLLCQVGH